MKKKLKMMFVHREARISALRKNAFDFLERSNLLVTETFLSLLSC